jgi:hypothetical protein
MSLRLLVGTCIVYAVAKPNWVALHVPPDRRIVVSVVVVVGEVGLLVLVSAALCLNPSSVFFLGVRLA